MKERPILMSGPMVKAILDGRKTVTRRTTGLEDVNAYPGRLDGDGVMGPLGYRGVIPNDYYVRDKRAYAKEPGLYHWFVGERSDPREVNPIPVRCPYGEVGSHLWVRETWCPVRDSQFGEMDWIDYRATPWESAEHPAGWQNASNDAEALKWRPSIHMPRSACRLVLELTDVRIERLHSITEADAEAEGVGPCWLDTNGKDVNWAALPRYRQGFAVIWRDLNDKRPGCSWDANPLVWRLGFRRVTEQSDA